MRCLNGSTIAKRIAQGKPAITLFLAASYKKLQGSYKTVL